MLSKFREHPVRYITQMLAAGLAMLLLFLLIDPWFGIWCALAGILFAVVMWFVSITLDTLDARRQLKEPKETP